MFAVCTILLRSFKQVMEMKWNCMYHNYQIACNESSDEKKRCQGQVHLCELGENLGGKATMLQGKVSLHVGCWFFNFIPFEVSSNISNIRCSVLSPDETPRRELKIWRAAEYFWRTSRCFIWRWNTVSNVWYFFSNKIIFEGEIKDANTEQFFIRFPNTH